MLIFEGWAAIVAILVLMALPIAYAAFACWFIKRFPDCDY